MIICSINFWLLISRLIPGTILLIINQDFLDGFLLLDTIWTRGSSFHLTKTICQKLEAKTKTTSGSGYHVLFGPAKQFLRKLKFLRFRIQLIIFFNYITLNAKIILIIEDKFCLSGDIINDILLVYMNYLIICNCHWVNEDVKPLHLINAPMMSNLSNCFLEPKER